jgi:hypothetical protein
MKMKHSTLYAVLAVIGFSAYMFYRKKEGGKSGPIKGIDLSLNPVQIVDGVIGSMNIHPIKREAIKHTVRRAMESYLNRNSKGNV